MEIAEDTKNRTAVDGRLMEVESAPATLQSFGLYGGGLLVPMGNFLPGRANQIWWARGTEDKHNAGYKWALAFDNQNF